MSDPSDRRGFLRGLVSLPLIGGGVTFIGAPSVALACADAPLFDLWRRREEAHVVERISSKRLDAISAATVFPDPPAALFLREGDHDLMLANYTCERGDGRMWYPFESANAERRGWRRAHWRWQSPPVTPEDNLPEDAHTVTFREAWPEAEVRADDITAAWDEHRAAVAAIRDESGFDAANDEWEARDDDVAALDGALRDATATTLAGLRITARPAQIDIDQDEDPDPLLIAGLVRDLLATGGAA